MKTFRFNCKILSLLGINLNSSLNSMENIKFFAIKFVICFHLIFFEIIPTIFYINDNLDDMINLLNCSYQIPAFFSVLAMFINMNYFKNVIKEIFDEIEAIVNQRKHRSYDRAISNSEIYIKHVILSISVLFTITATVKVLVNLVEDLAKGEIHTEDWFLFVQFKFVELRKFCLLSLHFDFVLCRLPWGKSTVSTYLLTFLVNLTGFYLYFALVYTQLNFIISFYFYLREFVDDIRNDLANVENKSQAEMRNELIEVVEFHLKILR